MIKRKINISKKLLVRLLVFFLLTFTAFLLDAYLHKNPAEINSNEASTKHQNPNQSEVYVLAQPVSFSVKTAIQKVSERKLQIEAHNKFLKDYHSIRNFQVLKAEVVHQTTPLIASYHYLVFQNHFFSPDDVPLS